MTTLFARSGAIGAIGVLAATSAFGQITMHPNEGTAGEDFETVLSIPHGCDSSETVSIRVTIPESVKVVKPQMKPGWKVKTKKRIPTVPMKSESPMAITETITEVSWSGGSLPDDLYDTFGLRMKLPNAAGQTLWFPVIQECKKGLRRWIDIPMPGQKKADFKSAAPFVRLVAKAP